MASPRQLLSVKAALSLSALCALVGCGTKGSSSAPVEPATGSTKIQSERPASCPVEQPAPELLPGVTEAHRSPDYWFRQLEGKVSLDEVLLNASELTDLNASLRVPRKGFFPQQDLLRPLDLDVFEAKVQERFDWMQSKLDKGEYRVEKGKAPEAAFQRPSQLQFEPRLRVALEETQLYCAASTVGFFDSDATSTRINRNRCSNAHAQELIEILAPWSGNMLLARTATSWGFIEAEAALSPPVEGDVAARFARGPFAVLQGDLARDSLSLKARQRLPLAEAAHRVSVATESGVSTLALEAAEYSPTPRPFTRRAVIEEALSYLGTPYGFGGLDGGIDCSRLLLDVFGAFGIHLPRFSGWQARAGSYHYQVGGLDDEAKLAILDEAQASGVVMMELPGHIMLYLGRDEKDVPMAVHALAYYLEPCEGGADTKRVVGRVQIGGLELGRGTHKTALIERIQRITVLGKAPPPELRSLAKLRPAAPTRVPSERECKKLPASRMHVSPARPEPGQPVRVIATSRSFLGPATISFYDSKGRPADSSSIETNGPPKGYIGQVDRPGSGKLMAVLGDGDKVYGCTSFRVSKRSRQGKSRLERKAEEALEKQAAVEALAGTQFALEEEASPAPGTEEGPPQASEIPIWHSKKEWGPIYEDLFATFSERLFDYPADADLTWPNLHTLLRDAERNIFFNHFGRDEEEALSLVPDCADLPYTLRAYFSWKMGLPFGVHECRRARENRPPTCDLAPGNLMSRLEFDPGDDIEVFASFVNRHVRRTVHSSSGRTAPDDDESDFYPVALSRETLRPGTLFTDPYGHLLVVVKWIDQGTEGYGALIGADAQPDGTVGRRRFWRGSFLFHPETSSGGAGFKAFRPWKYDRATKSLMTPSNSDLRRDKTAKYSREQYKGSESDFYDKMEAIINPRPLEPLGKMTSLVDALEEQVSRRITSVTNGEDFMKSRAFAPIEMPTGSKIFLTSGPWEDFSTPSRDWRLLVAIHTVADFPEAVRRSPEQYGFTAETAPAEAAKLQKALDKELSARTFEYVRSDGSSFGLNLKNLVDRRVDFEMSYNPNDCPELRWAAPEGSKERSTCKRQAPADQRAKMLEYRPWFAQRRRPAS